MFEISNQGKRLVNRGPLHVSTFGQPQQKYTPSGEFGPFGSLIMDHFMLATNLVPPTIPHPIIPHPILPHP